MFHFDWNIPSSTKKLSTKQKWRTQIEIGVQKLQILPNFKMGKTFTNKS
jgi:hypothetical protein